MQDGELTYLRLTWNVCFRRKLREHQRQCASPRDQMALRALRQAEGVPSRHSLQPRPSRRLALCAPGIFTCSLPDSSHASKYNKTWIGCGHQDKETSRCANLTGRMTFTDTK